MATFHWVEAEGKYVSEFELTGLAALLKAAKPKPQLDRGAWNFGGENAFSKFNAKLRAKH